MSLKEQLFADLKTAMKEKDTVRKDTVQLIRSAFCRLKKIRRSNWMRTVFWTLLPNS